MTNSLFPVDVKLLESISKHLDILTDRIEGGWNAKDETLRSYELSTATELVKNTKFQIDQIVSKYYDTERDKRKAKA